MHCTLPWVASHFCTFPVVTDGMLGLYPTGILSATCVCTGRGIGAVWLTEGLFVTSVIVTAVSVSYTLPVEWILSLRVVESTSVSLVRDFCVPNRIELLWLLLDLLELESLLSELCKQK